jgi:hypothetical protein
METPLKAFGSMDQDQVKSGVLKLGVATLLSVAKYFIGVAKGLLSGQFTLDSL